MLRFYLAAAQFVLGDLAAPAEPSAAIAPRYFADRTLFEAIEEAARQRIRNLGASIEQTVSAEIPKKFGPDLTPAEREQIRLKLDTAGVSLVACTAPRLPEGEARTRLLEFCRIMGVEPHIAE